MFTVYRVHWLRARARNERWKEEMDLTSHEMVWTVNFFDHKAGLWDHWSQESLVQEKLGHYSYAMRQIGIWKSMSEYAINAFQKAILAQGGDPDRFRGQPEHSVTDSDRVDGDENMSHSDDSGADPAAAVAQSCSRDDSESGDSPSA